ncbi:MAG: hypothetical protein CL930_06785 [Deltaproteobacteria bacterium]|nr:hypothetical protein [Deltaproteobacteria bacterium]
MEDLGTTTGDSVATGVTVTASDDIGGSCGSSGGVDSNYSWTPPISGTYCLDTFGSDYDTVIRIYDEDCGEEIDCNDDADGGRQSEIRDEYMSVGLTYVIVVDGYSAYSEGSFQLNINPC